VEIGASTRLLTLVGDPVAHSLSPVMYNAACRALGLDAVYVALRVPPSEVSTVFQALAATGGAGNVTVPHKAAAERSVVRKTDVCARAGACNTFWTEDGVLVGDNTDVAGVRGALTALGTSNGGGGRWLVIGTGGSARAVAVAAADAGAALWVRSRHPERARAFTTWASQIGVRVAAAHGPVEVDTAINATPLGLGDRDPLPIEPKDVKGVRTALDLVYAPGGTRWVRTLRERVKDVAATDGRDVLVQQGAAAFSRFFPGVAAPLEVMRAAVERALRA
jgi:shikimate dehydrogenase